MRVRDFAKGTLRLGGSYCAWDPFSKVRHPCGNADVGMLGAKVTETLRDREADIDKAKDTVQTLAAEIELHKGKHVRLHTCRCLQIDILTVLSCS